MKKAIALAIATVVVLAVSVDASAAVKIVKIYFDSPGADTGTNYSLNREWIQIHNGGLRAVAIGDWRIRDRSGHVFKLPHIKLKPGQDVRVHTGGGYDAYGDPIHLYWRSSSYIWNNNGDTATLKRRNGTVASRCSYTGAGSYKIC
jgi:hypothetical protein